MEITSRTEGSKVTMEISGWLDTQTAPKLEYISSAGLRQVISAYKKMAGKE